MKDQQSKQPQPYNYTRFTTDVLTHFENFKGPKPGEAAPDFTATTLEGKTVKLSDFRGKVVVMETGSITCPMFRTDIGKMNELRQRFTDVVFLVLYTREAHPGEKIGHHESFEEKLKQAQCLPKENNEERIVLVDGLKGTAHALYGLLPNSVHIIDPEGKLLFRGDWADSRDVEKVLSQAQETFSEKRYKTVTRIVPLQSFRIFLQGGWRSLLDFVRTMPRLIRNVMRYRQK